MCICIFHFLAIQKVPQVWLKFKNGCKLLFLFHQNVNWEIAQPQTVFLVLTHRFLGRNNNSSQQIISLVKTKLSQRFKKWYHWNLKKGKFLIKSQAISHKCLSACQFCSFLFYACRLVLFFTRKDFCLNFIKIVSMLKGNKFLDVVNFVWFAEYR